VCDVVIFYVFVALSFLAERSDEDGVVLRGDEGDSIEVDDGGHDHGSNCDDPIKITPTSNTGNCPSPSAGNLYRIILCCLRRLVEKKKHIEKR